MANEINRTVDGCKTKMEELLSSVRREKMKMKSSGGTGKGEYQMKHLCFWQCIYFVVR